MNKKDNDDVRKYIIENYHAPNLADEEFQKNQNWKPLMSLHIMYGWYIDLHAYCRFNRFRTIKTKYENIGIWQDTLAPEMLQLYDLTFGLHFNDKSFAFNKSGTNFSNDWDER